MDMFPHWRYVLDDLFGGIKALSAVTSTHIGTRVDEEGNTYNATADDAAYATFELENGVIASVNSSWAVRVNRDDLLTIQVDGTEGSAVAGLRQCKTQHRINTPKPVWNPDLENTIDFQSQWSEVPDNQIFDNAFKVQWELFLNMSIRMIRFLGICSREQKERSLPISDCNQPKNAAGLMCRN